MSIPSADSNKELWISKDRTVIRWEPNPFLAHLSWHLNMSEHIRQASRVGPPTPFA